MDNVAVIAGMRSRRRCCSPCYGAQTSPDRRTDASTMAAAGNRTDYSPSAGSEQTTPQRALAGIIRVRRSRQRINQSRSDHTDNGRLLSHSPHLHTSLKRRPLEPC
jgi:hypothetical protein